MKNTGFRFRTLLAVGLLGLSLAPATAQEADVLILGIWPNRLRLLDTNTKEFIGEIPLRYGAVSNYFETAHTPDFERLFFVTDRMEAVEIVDPESRSVVDEFRLSTPERRVRILRVIPDPLGKTLFLNVVVVGLQPDRFLPEKVEFLVYDLDKKEVVESLYLPDLELGFFNTFFVSEDGDALFAVTSDIHAIDTSSYEVREYITLSEASAAGYGPMTPIAVFRTGPSTLHGIYSTRDPILEKSMSGVFRIDLESKRLERFDLPAFDAEVLAISPDGKYAYAGMRDLVKIDLEKRRLAIHKDDFERGRTNNTLIVSADGAEIYIGGVGDTLHVHDAETLEHLRSIFVGGDIMSPPLALPAPD